MRPQIILLSVLFAVSTSCSEGGKKKPDQDSSRTVTTAQNKVKPPSSYSDTLVIYPKAAVFYHPDSLQDLAIKAITDSGIYKSSVHEMFYQMRYSRIVLKKYYPDVKIVEAKNVRYLLFKKEGNTAECIDLNTKNDASGLFVFDGHQPPSLLDMTNIETELGFYFKKQ